jgi:hypothetical protein
MVGTMLCEHCGKYPHFFQTFFWVGGDQNVPLEVSGAIEAQRHHTEL